MNGFVDVQGRRIHGWAFDQQTNWPASVDVYVDGVKAGSAVADQHRPDLTAVTPDGRCAFEFFLPAELMDGTPRMVEVRPRGASAPLQYGTFKFQFPSPDYVAGLAQWIMRLGWWVLGCAIEDGVVEIGGWFVSPLGGEEGRISVNGQSIVITTTEQREEWTAHFAPRPRGAKFLRQVSARTRVERFALLVGPGTALSTAAEHLLSAVTGGDARRGAPLARAWQHFGNRVQPRGLFGR